MMAEAGLINIGDELLRGQIIDTNSSYLASNLYATGIKLCKAAILPDKIEDIAKEVSEFSERFSVVFTCGGVGPTHDDMTYEAICKAFNLKLEKHPRLMEIYSNIFSGKSEFHRFATVPVPCEIIEIEYEQLKRTFAVIKVNNVYVLPGSPKYFRLAVDKIMSLLKGGMPLFHTEIDVALDELSILAILDEHVARWKDSVTFGSYPQMDLELRTKITFEGSRKDVCKAKQDFISSLPSSSLVLDQKFTLQKAQLVVRSNASHPHVRNALKCLEQCFDAYEMHEIFLSFNGGKDCTLVLHLAVAVMRMRALESLLCLYVSSDSFPEVEEFIAKATDYYGFKLVVKEKPIKSALVSLVEEKPRLKACLMGTRRNDPGSEGLQTFTSTDSDWPELMRVNPILDWSYKQVWDFLLDNDVPYCSLYDQGYTSLGAKSTTKKNPLLVDTKNPSLYRPAHTLADDSTERHGRHRNS